MTVQDVKSVVREYALEAANAPKATFVTPIALEVVALPAAKKDEPSMEQAPRTMPL